MKLFEEYHHFSLPKAHSSRHHAAHHSATHWWTKASGHRIHGSTSTKASSPENGRTICCSVFITIPKEIRFCLS